MNQYAELSDLEIMKKIRNYDSRALEELYNRYSAAIYTLTKKIVTDEELAANLIVEIFAIIWRKSDHFNFSSGNVYTWIITLTRNKAVDSKRRVIDKQIDIEEYDDQFEDFFILPILSNDIDGLDIETAMHIKPQIEKALADLTDAQRYVIHLAYYDGLTMAEIANELNIPVETVRSKVLTALTNLKENLISGSIA